MKLTRKTSRKRSRNEDDKAVKSKRLKSKRANAINSTENVVDDHRNDPNKVADSVSSVDPTKATTDSNAIAIGQMSVEYPNEITYDGHRVDLVKSGLQKYIRRSMHDKALYCVKQLDLFADLPDYKGEKIRTNMIHRLMIIFLEDIGVGGLHLWPELDKSVTVLKVTRDAFLQRMKTTARQHVPIVSTVSTHPMFAKQSSLSGLSSFRFRALEISLLRNWIDLTCKCNKSRLGDHLNVLPCSVETIRLHEQRWDQTPFRFVYRGKVTPHCVDSDNRNIITLLPFRSDVPTSERRVLKFQDCLTKCLEYSYSRCLTNSNETIKAHNKICLWALKIQTVLYAKLLHEAEYDKSIFNSMLVVLNNIETMYESKLTLQVVIHFQYLKTCVKLGMKWYSYLKTLKEQFLTWMVPLSAILFGLDKTTMTAAFDDQDQPMASCTWSDVKAQSLDDHYIYDKHVYQDYDSSTLNSNALQFSKSDRRQKWFFALHGAQVSPQSRITDPWLEWFYKYYFGVADQDNPVPTNTDFS